MADFCTCGAQLPPDARFCHKCGKPQRDEPLLADAAPLPPPPSAPPAALPIGFRNALAVRIGFLSALLASLLSAALLLACPLWLVASGFLCVYVYHRRTGQALSVGGGVRMGWITGLFSFAIYSPLFVFSFVSQVRSGEMFDRLKDTPFFQGSAEQLRNLFSNPVYLTFDILLSLGLLFAAFTMFCVAGGALGAKVLRKE